MISQFQTNTRPQGVVSFKLDAALPKEAPLLLKKTETGVAAPTAATDLPVYLYDGMDISGEALCIPLVPGEQRRFLLKGAIKAGEAAAQVVGGEVQKAASGNICIGIAEENGVDGQYVRVRIYNLGLKLA